MEVLWCSQCSHQYEWEFQVNRHVQRAHRNVYAAELFHAIVEPEQFPCISCEFRSYYHWDLNEHYKHPCHGQVIDNLEPRSSCVDFGNYICACCRFKSNASLLLTKHKDFCGRLRIHTVTTEAESPPPHSNVVDLATEPEVAEIEPKALRQLLDPKKSKRKQNCCLFCYRSFTNIVAHFENSHGDKNDVIKFSALPKKSAERTRILELLRKKGNYELKNRTNTIVPTRNGYASSVRKDKFVACQACLGIYQQNSLRKHLKKCTSLERKPRKFDRCREILSRKTNAAFREDASENLRSVCLRLKADAEIIKSDLLLVSFGNKLCGKNGRSLHENEATTKLRLLAKFLVTIKNINKNITNFRSVFKPKFYHDVVKTAASLANNSKSATFDLLLLIEELAEHMELHVLESLDSNYAADLSNFRDLLANHETLKRDRRSESQDMKKLYNYLVHQRQSFYGELSKSGFNRKLWSDLASCTLASAQFGARPGEVELMLIADFRDHEKVDEERDKEILAGLGHRDRESVMKHVRIRSKSNNVCTAIDGDTFACIEMILKCRGEAGVPDKNPFVFGLPAPSDERGHRHLNVCDLLKAYCNECGAGNPARLRATLLREHSAAPESKSAATGSAKSVSRKKNQDCARIPRVTGKAALAPEAFKHPSEVKEVREAHAPLLDRDKTRYSTNQSSEKLVNLDLTVEKRASDKSEVVLKNIRCRVPQYDKIAKLTTRPSAVSQKKFSEFFTRIPVVLLSPLEIESSPERTTHLSEGESYKYFNRPFTLKLNRFFLGSLLDSVLDYVEMAKHSIFDSDIVNNDRRFKKMSKEVTPRNLYDNIPAVEAIVEDSESDGDPPNLPAKVQRREDIIQGRWTREEKEAVMALFGEPIRNKTLPPWKSVKEAHSEHQELKGKTPQQMYAFIKYRCDRNELTIAPIAARTEQVRSTSPFVKEKIIRRRWTTPEKDILVEYFQEEIHSGVLPGMAKCRYVSEQQLQTRTPMQIFAYVNNVTKGVQRPPNQPEKVTVRRNWTSSEKRVIEKYFGRELRTRVLPKIAACRYVSENELKSRTPQQIFAYVNNVNRQAQKALDLEVCSPTKSE